MKDKKIVIDLDGTICTEEKTFDKFLSVPNENAISVVNKLFEKHFIIIYTARGWAEYNITSKWLEKYNINYDILMCGKPIYDYWIDDRAIKYNNWGKINEKINKNDKHRSVTS
jgi:uncharacterized HAD superfamily protein